MNTTIKESIVKFIESQGQASKSKIEDYMKETRGTTGDCVSRRMRELVSEGVLSKVQKEHNGKKYFSYSVIEPSGEKLGVVGKFIQSVLENL